MMTPEGASKGGAVNWSYTNLLNELIWYSRYWINNYFCKTLQENDNSGAKLEIKITVILRKIKHAVLLSRIKSIILLRKNGSAISAGENKNENISLRENENSEGEKLKTH